MTRLLNTKDFSLAISSLTSISVALKNKERNNREQEIKITGITLR